MPKTDAEFNDLMQRVLAGSETAAEEFFRDYEPYLLHAVRRRLDKRLRSQFDSLDFAQDVWASFFADRPDKRAFAQPGDLVAFLTEVAPNKVLDANRQRLGTRKYNVRLEESLDDSAAFDKDRLMGQEPTPSQALSKEEEWSQFLRKQPLVYRRIFILLREGKEPAETPRELGIPPRTVLRAMQRRTRGTIS